MNRTYKTTGITLKSAVMGENDHLLTILTPDYGLLRLIAPGSRKYNSPLGGRCGVFRVNELLITKGKSLDKITQAETRESYGGLSQSLVKLAAGQYLAEIALQQSIAHYPQPQLFTLLTEHLRRLEQNSHSRSYLIIPLLTHGIFHLLALEGIAPHVHVCCLTQEPLIPNFSSLDWRVGFSILAGGIFDLSSLEQFQLFLSGSLPPTSLQSPNKKINGRRSYSQKLSLEILSLTASQLAIFQELSQPDLPPEWKASPTKIPQEEDWLLIEKILRTYTEYHLDYTIRSASLIEESLSLS